jgi:hypothetical protein
MPRFADSHEARKAVFDLRSQLKTIRYNPDLRKMLKNIEQMVDELSSIEVKARQSKQPNLGDSLRVKLESAVDYLEKLILMMRLLN